MSSGYNKTTIIDCARSQSEEAIARNDQNPAMWTNRIGTGLHLKVGDQITVHSSYISELGCQTGQIQIKGEKIGETSTEITQFSNKLRNEDLPEKFTLVEAENVDTPIDIRDDTLNLVVSPYKTTNGENYMFLPRRFGVRGPDQDWAVFDVREEGASPGFGITPGTDIGATRNPQRPLARCSDDWTTVQRPHLSSGATSAHKIAQKNDGKRFTIFTRPQTFHGDITTPEITLTGKATAGSPIIELTHGSVGDEILVGMALTAQSPDTVFAANASVIAVSTNAITMFSNASANTNSHNLFTFQFTTSTEATYLPPTTVSGSYTANQAQALRDPAIFGGDFIQVRNLLSVKVNPGYNSPSDIAVQLTEELNQRTDIEYLKYKTVNTANNAEEDIVFSMKTETPTYKHYHCATATNYKKNYFDEWFKTDGSWDIDEAYHHLGCYQFIGVKRPELLLAGQKLNGSEGLPLIGNASGTDFINALDKVLMTNHLWTEENLLKWKEFFDTQTIYPELFDDFTQSGISVSVDDTRFFHMNLYDESRTNLQPNPYENANASFAISRAENPVPALGYDLYNSAVSSSHTSFPIFVDYNINSSDKKADDVGFANYGGEPGTNQFRANQRMDVDFDDLAYGFARKVQRQTGPTEYTYYIGFQFTRTGNKIPDHFFQHNASSFVSDGSASQYQLGTGKGRRYGFDRHFTAYGNAMMILYNGNVNQVANDRDAKSEKKYQFAQKESEKNYYLDAYQFGLYLGADGPLINYDTDQSRFTLCYFHTPEKVGNRWNAGSQSVFPNIPSNPNDDDDCYKLNKRLLETNYTPEMNPYEDEFKATMSSGSEASFISHNPSIVPYSIMDAHSGLFIEDWLCPEDLWNDSLIGIMGFRWNQFHNPESTNSRQVRIKAHGANADLHNVNIITTNADVNEGDIIEYSKNIYSQNIYSIANPVGVSGPTFTSVPYMARFISPPITISPAESVKITAERLPTKTLRPYYTIRSDILLENNYLGGNRSGITLPIVSITNKANPYGDFLNGQGEITFTNTIDRVLTSIKCSIHEPSGDFARVDLDSAVIFKIDQQMTAQLDIISELLASKALKDRKQAQAIEEAGPGGQGV
jgi:hypothetical protein